MLVIARQIRTDAYEKFEFYESRYDKLACSDFNRKMLFDMLG